jgi:hypothetical protein
MRIANNEFSNCRKAQILQYNKPMSENCTLTNEELIEKVKSLTGELCKTGGRSWSLRIPADANNDPDMLIFELCDRLEKATQCNL